jgi:hypothetical protein
LFDVHDSPPLINNFDREGDYISFAGLTKPLYKHSVLMCPGRCLAKITGVIVPVAPLQAALTIQHRTAAIAADFLCAGPAAGTDGERDMKAGMTTALLIPLLLGAGMLTFVQSAHSDVNTECYKEAQHYGVSPELVDEYVEGCMQSRGGYSDAAVVEEYVSTQETGEQAEAPQDVTPDETATTGAEGAHVAQ